LNQIVTRCVRTPRQADAGGLLLDRPKPCQARGSDPGCSLTAFSVAPAWFSRALCRLRQDSMASCENQLLELRRYCDARGWTIHAEYTDEMSGAKDRRPGLERLLLDARRARFHLVVCWALDRIGRDLKHLLAVLEDLQWLNIPFVSLKEGLDLGSASGRLQLAILAALSQFERERLKERTVAGLHRARAQGKRLGRPSEPVPVEKLEFVKGISVRLGAKRLGVARSTLQRWRALARQNPSVAV
jgi:DNA invertase Pin-like site-specific DNA recombinase